MGDAEAPTGTSKRSQPAAFLLGSGVGLSVGAVLLGGYAFGERTPAGVHDPSVTTWAAASAVLLAVAALALLWNVRTALRGTDATRRSAWVLTAVAPVTAYAVLAERDGWAASTRAGLALLRLPWVVMAIAAVLAVAGTVWAVGRAPSPRVRRNPALAAALVVGLVLAVAGGALVRARTDTAVTVTPRDVPAMPTTVGADVAYAIPTEDPSFVVPAGPGFVMSEDDAMVGYAGDTGQVRWRLPFDMVGLNCHPSSVRSTGTSADSVVIAQCLRTDPSANASLSSASDRVAVLTGIEAMTGRVLWTNGDNWRIRSTVVTGPDVVPVLRGGEVAALDPRTGNLLWSNSFEHSDCGENVVGLNNQAQEIVYFPVCGDEIVLRIADGRTGAERTMKVQSPELTDDVVRAELAAADGNVLVISAEREPTGRAILAVDLASGEIADVPVEYLRTGTSSYETGQYPGPVLEIERDSGTTSTTTVYLVAQRRVVELSAPVIANFILDRQRWAQVGDELVTATAATAGYRSLLATVAADGTATGHPSPCGGVDAGGVIPVPGAVLIVCARTEDQNVVGYDVIGLR